MLHHKDRAVSEKFVFPPQRLSVVSHGGGESASTNNCPTHKLTRNILDLGLRTLYAANCFKISFPSFCASPNSF